MQYVGIHTQQSRNNFRSLLLLCLFPCLVVGLLFVFCYLLVYLTQGDAPHYYQVGITDRSVALFIEMAPYVLGGVFIWFLPTLPILPSSTLLRVPDRWNGKKINVSIIWWRIFV